MWGFQNDDVSGTKQEPQIKHLLVNVKWAQKTALSILQPKFSEYYLASMRSATTKRDSIVLFIISNVQKNMSVVFVLYWFPLKSITSCDGELTKRFYCEYATNLFQKHKWLPFSIGMLKTLSYHQKCHRGSKRFSKPCQDFKYGLLQTCNPLTSKSFPPSVKMKSKKVNTRTTIPMRNKSS